MGWTCRRFSAFIESERNLKPLPKSYRRDPILERLRKRFLSGVGKRKAVLFEYKQGRENAKRILSYTIIK